MSTLFQKFLALFYTPNPEVPDTPATQPALTGMPLASAAYLREFAQRLGLEVDDLSPAEQAVLKARLDNSMDFREENYGFLYHEVYRLGHGYSLDDATRVSSQINAIAENPAANAYLNYRENAVAAEALMAAGAFLQQEGQAVAAEHLFTLADARRHRSSQLEANLEEQPSGGSGQDVGREPIRDVDAADTGSRSGAASGSGASTGQARGAADSPEGAAETGITGLMNGPSKAAPMPQAAPKSQAAKPKAEPTAKTAPVPAAQANPTPKSGK